MPDETFRRPNRRFNEVTSNTAAKILHKLIRLLTCIKLIFISFLSPQGYNYSGIMHSYGYWQ